MTTIERTILFISVLVANFAANAQQHPKTTVFIVSTIHGAHVKNPNYTYQHLFDFISKQDPDVIGVEIRNEDLKNDENYLKEIYPFEMYETVKIFQHKKLVGVDWFGNQLTGKKISREDFKNHIIYKFQQQIKVDTSIQKKLSIIDIIRKEKDSIVLNASLNAINDGKYDLINRIYYAQLQHIHTGTIYNELTDFYIERDEHIAQNIINTIAENTGKKLLFIVGADHRDFTIRALQHKFKQNINLHKF